MVTSAVLRTVLVRSGAIPEVSRCGVETGAAVCRGDIVVVRTHRGLQLGAVLEEVRTLADAAAGETPSSTVVRIATADDRLAAAQNRLRVEADFDSWTQRIRRWNLQLELIDLETTLDGEKLVLYVLNERGPECTKLALQAAAAGLGIIEVQPVGLEGLLTVSGGGGCGSGGCGNGGCSH